jgi:hypothetical protein
MDRPSIRYAIALLLILTAALAPALGCRQVMTTAAYLINGTDVDAEFKELKGKKVAVVCRPLTTLQYRDSNAGRDIAQQVATLLQKEVSKIQIIDQRKINKWTDENTWEEYSEVGKAVKAEMVVGIDLESFSIFQGQTLYQGKADATIRVFDCRHGNKMVFEKQMPQCVYPPSAGIATSERSEATFRHEFLLVLANRIARHFYSHDPYEDVGQDAMALK